MKDCTRTALTGEVARGVATLLAGATLALAHAADAPPGPENFFQYARMTQAAISPDGQTVALTTAPSSTARVRLVALDLKTMKFTALAGFEDADVDAFHWVNDHRLVFDLDDRQAPEGKLDAAWGLYGVNADGSSIRELVSQYGKPFIERGGERGPLPWNTAFLSTVGDRTSEDVYIYTFQEYDRKHVDYRQLQRLETVHGYAFDVDTPVHSKAWVFDAKGELRVATTEKDDVEKVYVRDPVTDKWSELGVDIEHSDPSFIDQDGTLFGESHAGDDKASVWTYDVVHHKMADKPFLVSQRYDLEPDYLALQGRLAGLRYDIDAEVTQWLVPEMEALQAKVDKMLPSTVNRLDVASRGDGHFVVIRAFSDRVPSLFFLYDTQKGKLIKLGDARPDVGSKLMAAMDQVHYAARDGLDIPAYLTIPHGAERKNLPLVVLVHGGPWVRGRCGAGIRKCSSWQLRATPCSSPSFAAAPGMARSSSGPA
jgi:hypothetical protein